MFDSNNIIPGISTVMVQAIFCSGIKNYNIKQFKILRNVFRGDENN